MGPDAAGLTDITNIFDRIVEVSVTLAFIALFLLLIWGGFKFVISGGDKESLKAASLTITWALLGMLFLVLAWLALRLIALFTGYESGALNLTIFDIRELCNATLTGPLPTPGFRLCP